MHQRRRAVLHLATVAAVGLLMGSCSADEKPADPPGSAAKLEASIIQWRSDEGTRKIDAEITNLGDAPITITSVVIDSPAFEVLPPTPKDTVYPPGRIIDLKTEYGDPVCDLDSDPTGTVIVTLDDGSTMRLPVNSKGEEWLTRIHTHECALELLNSIATISLQGDFDEVKIAGERYLSGRLVFERPAGSAATDESLRVAEIAGSTLLGFHPNGPDVFPAELKPGVPRLDLPILIGSARCDGHAFAESKQTFLLNLYIQTAEYPQQRVIVEVPHEVQPRAMRLIESICNVHSMVE